jgi:hypothetical protein
MAKDPAFLFYPADASQDTQFMNRLERGAYFDLVKGQRMYGGFTVVQLRKILGNDFESVWPSLELVLEFDGERYFVGWLRLSISKRDSYSEKQSERVKKRWHNDGNTVVLPKKEIEIENENETLIDIEIKEENQKFQSLKKSESIEDRKLKFAETLKPFIEKYGREFLIEFYNYWTEPNKSGKKFRQEDQNFWDLSKRLSTWEKNNKGNSYTNGFQNQPKTIQQDFANSKIGKAMQASQEADFIIDEMVRLKNEKQNESANSN